MKKGWRYYKVFGHYIYKKYPGVMVYVHYHNGGKQIAFFNNMGHNNTSDSRKVITYNKFIGMRAGLSEEEATSMVKQMEEAGVLIPIQD